MPNSILVGLDESPYSEAAVALGVDWAKRFDCLLVGMGVVDEPSIRGPRQPEQLTASFRAAYSKMVAEASHRVDQILERFTLRCAEEGVSSKLLEDIGSPSEQIITEAQRYDLIVLGTKSFFHFETSTQECETLDRLLHTTPRPVVTVPSDYRAGNGVLIAYDGSLQAARALHAFAASGLSAIGDVHVYCVHNTSAVEAGKIVDRAIEYLRFHQIEAHPHPVVGENKASDEILQAADQFGVELIVMGSYGRNRLAEFLVGSVTRSVLEKSGIPLFLYH